MRRERNVWVADFETRAGEQAIAEGRTWVWAWGLVNIDHLDLFEHGTDMNSFMDRVRYLGNGIIFFHNLRFDGAFLLYELYKRGYRKTYNRRLEVGEVSELIDQSGRWFCIRVRFSTRCYIEFRDSMKLIPASVESIGQAWETGYQKRVLDDGYEVEHVPGTPLTDNEREYLRADCLTVAAAVSEFFKQGYDGLTIGSCCMQRFMDTIGVDKFFALYPRLSEAEDAAVRRAYRGGWCYVNPDAAHKTIQSAFSYDVNSLYPYAMHSSSGNIFPFGPGVEFSGRYVPNRRFPLFFQRIECEFWLKPDGVPFIQLKNYAEYRPNEYPRETLHGPVELCLSSVDIDMFFQHYDVVVTRWLGGYMYRATKGTFDKYIDEFMAQKMHEKGAKRQIAKLFLNNLYGKFATSPDVRARSSYYDADSDKLKFHTSELMHRKSVYLPVAAYVTSYARRQTIQAVMDNRANFLYSDTDSIYLTAPAVGIDIDPVELGKWKFEGKHDFARFVKQKCYILKDEDSWTIRASGMGATAKAVLLDKLKSGEYTIDDYDVGLHLPGADRKGRTFAGGVILVPHDYTLTA